MTAVDKSASDKANPTGEARGAKLIAWFNAGAGGRIVWGKPGAFDSCVRIAGDHMTTEKAQGFCANRHHDATGKWPGEGKRRNKVTKAGRLALLRRLLSAHPATKIDCPSCCAKVSAFAGTCSECGAVVTAAAKALGMKTSAMVALYPSPDVAQSLALPGGELPESLHVTLGLLGSDAVVRLDRDKIEEALRAFAAVNAPVAGVVGGLARFTPVEEGEPWPLVALVDAPGLTEFRQRLVGTLAGAGVEVSNLHGFTAHCTLALVETGDEWAAGEILSAGTARTPMHFESIVLAWGDDRTAFRLDGDASTGAMKAVDGVRTFDEKREMVNRALKLAYAAGDDSWVYAQDLTDEWAIFELSGKTDAAGLYRVRYVIEDWSAGDVLFGDPEPVERRTEYVPKAAPRPVVKATAGPVIKSDEAKRYTFAPLYPASPETPAAGDLDAHGDFATADDLQAAVWDYVRAGDRTIRDQHRDGTAIGEMVEIVSWPYPVTVPMMGAGGVTVEKSFAPGTVFLGVVWNELGWSDVVKGVKRGYSLGGLAIRTATEMSA